MVRRKDNAFVRPTAAAPQQGRAHARTMGAYPTGVSKTLSGKFQARIKLNGKRYDLGSDFTSPQEAGVAYLAAKQAGATAKASPKKRGTKRGTGTSPIAHPFEHVSLFLILCALVSAVCGRGMGCGPVL